MERESSVECSVFFCGLRNSKLLLRNRPSRNSTMFSSRRSAKCPVLKFKKGSEGFFTLWSRKLRFTNCICRYTCFTKRGKPFKVVVKQEIKKVLANKENAFTLSIERLNLVVLYHVTRWFGRQNLLYSGELIAGVCLKNTHFSPDITQLAGVCLVKFRLFRFLCSGE